MHIDFANVFWEGEGEDRFGLPRAFADEQISALFMTLILFGSVIVLYLVLLPRLILSCLVFSPLKD